jgi:hypothetical protein
MSIDAESVCLSPFFPARDTAAADLHAHVLIIYARLHRLQDASPITTRRPYVCPALWADCPSFPQHWDLVSGDKHLDISEEDGYVLVANGEGSTSGAFVSCDPLSAVRRARAGRLRIKPWILHRRRVFGITTSSPTSTSPIVSFLLSLPTDLLNKSNPPQPSSGLRIHDRLPLTPSTPNTDFRNLYNSLRQRDPRPLPAAKAAPPEVPSASLISPPLSPAASRTPSSLRQQRPVLYVQTSSPVGTSAPPPTPALPSPHPSTAQFRPSGRLPKRPPLPVWPAEHYPRAVVV